MTSTLEQDRGQRSGLSGLAAQLWRKGLAAIAPVRRRWRDFASGIGQTMPKGLYARSLIIIIAPMVLLELIVSYVFMERHWQTVTARLSEAAVRDIAAVISMLDTFPGEEGRDNAMRIAAEQLRLNIAFLPPDPLPHPIPTGFLDILDQTLSERLARIIGKPFWINTAATPRQIEIRIRLPDNVLQVYLDRNSAYASNSHIFIVWMFGSSLVILAIAVLFLRNQIRPIERLASAAENFGRGQPIGDFRPRGAREVREATLAFLEMRRRIERQIEQRTTMLAGVSHDLRTVLTRFRLQLAFMEGADADELKRDVDEMQGMLEGYLAFAKGDAGEEAASVDIAALLESVADDARRAGAAVSVHYAGEPMASLRPQGMRRMVTNLVSNAARHGDQIEIRGDRRPGWLVLTVDDDGPGIAPEHYDDVFRPFVRLDEARNLDESGTGLGLAIALDIAGVHGGGITLGKGPLGGLRVTVKLPV
jgi:two-component system osmolarity sensor histidine kinase EnvZ